MKAARVRVPRLTRPQQHVLVGALLFGHVPAVFQASVRALKAEKLVKVSRLGNIVLTTIGRLVAMQLHDSLVQSVKARHPGWK